MSRRNPYFDNVKFVLILLVVMGHAMEVVNHPTVWKMYSFIYLFHMPAFILITGYFSKKFKFKHLFELLMHYLIFQVLYLAFQAYLRNESLILQFKVPYWLLWFTLSTICWKLIAPVLSKLKGSILLSFLLGLGVGLIGPIGIKWSLSRTIVFLPFFMMGYHLKPQHFQTLKKYLPPILGLALFIFVGSYFFMKQPFKSSVLLGSRSYQSMRMSARVGLITRLQWYLISSTLVLLLFSWIPAKLTLFTKMGSRTVQAYLLHGFLIVYLKHIKFSRYIQSPMAYWIYLLIAVIITLCLLSKPVSYLLMPLDKLSSTLFKSKELEV